MNLVLTIQLCQEHTTNTTRKQAKKLKSIVKKEKEGKKNEDQMCDMDVGVAAHSVVLSDPPTEHTESVTGRWTQRT